MDFVLDTIFFPVPRFKALATLLGADSEVEFFRDFPQSFEIVCFGITPSGIAKVVFICVGAHSLKTWGLEPPGETLVRTLTGVCISVVELPLEVGDSHDGALIS